MVRDDEILQLEVVAEAFRTISRATSYNGLASALLEAALDYCGTARGAVLLSESGELFAKADAGLPREKARVFVSRPTMAELRLPEDVSGRVVQQKETVVRRGLQASALTNGTEPAPMQEIELLFLPVLHHELTIGVLYLESPGEQARFTANCVVVLSMLASQAATLFGSAQLFDALRETNMWMLKGQELGHMGSYRWNTRTLLSRASRECYRIFDIDLSLGPVPFETFRSRIHEDDLPGLEQALAAAVRTQSPIKHEYRVVHRDGTIRYVVAFGEFDHGPSGDIELEGIITDITESRAAEQALADAQSEMARAGRLASLGELAGSIIHEVSQPLTGIIASAEACLRWLAKSPAKIDEARESALRIVSLGHRTSNVVTGLRSLVQGGGLHIAKVRVNEAIEEVMVLTKRDIDRAGVTLLTDLDPSIPDIEADKIQLQQVVHNLVRNAIEAMAEDHTGWRVLTVRSTNSDSDVSVTVSDTGAGLDCAISERLFEPLQTTKAGGLGLGLAICRKIVQAHGGKLWLARNTTRGSTFAFTVPLRHPTHLCRSD